jgi:hypothetical protein
MFVAMARGSDGNGRYTVGMRVSFPGSSRSLRVRQNSRDIIAQYTQWFSPLLLYMRVVPDPHNLTDINAFPKRLADVDLFLLVPRMET